MLTAKNRAILQMLICAALWSSGGILIKLVPWNSFVLSGARSLVAMITIGVFMICTRQSIIINRQTVSGAAALCLTYTCFVAANKLTTAANAIVLQFSSPLFIMLISALLLHQRIKRQDALAVLFTFIGIALCFFDHLDAGRMFGNLIGILAGLFMALMYILIGDGQDGAARLSAILLGQALTAVLGIPFAIVSPPVITLPAVLSVLALGVVQIGIAYILYGLAASACPPLACCLLGAVEPLLNPLWVFLFDGEHPGVLALIGGLLVIATVTVWCVRGERKEGKANAANT